MRKTLLIVYHSLTGGTQQMAEAARAGAIVRIGDMPHGVMHS